MVKALSTPLPFKVQNKSQRKKKNMKSLEINSISVLADNTNNTDENKNNNSDIICSSYLPYFPQQLLGKVEERFIETIDYMVGMDNFDNVFKELGIDDKALKREGKIYDVLDIDILKKLKVLSDDDVKQIGDYTNRVESSELYTIIGYDVFVMKHLQQYHIQDMLNDIKEGLIHKFIELNYQKTRLILHLFPYKCMKAKNITYSEAMSYCISIMWATLVNIVAKNLQGIEIIDLLKQVFHDLNPISTKIVISTKRELTSNGFSFIQELEQLTAADKFIEFKTSVNRVIIRWSPRLDRFENYIHKFYRTQTDNWDDIVLKDLRGDSNGKRSLKFDCRIKDKFLITKITAVGQNIMRDVTGYYTTAIYGLLCDEEQLEHYELSSLFTILTGTKEHNDLFKNSLIRSYMYAKANNYKFVFKDNLDNNSFEDFWDSTNSKEKIKYDEEIEPISDTPISPREKSKYLKRLSEVSIFKSDEKNYPGYVVNLAVNRTNKKVFCDLKLNNDYYLATQLIIRFDLKRNIPKDIMTVLKIVELPEDKIEEALQLVERHKRPRIREMVQYVRTLEKPKPILNKLYNYLWIERYV